jgi:hypothetical protein
MMPYSSAMSEQGPGGAAFRESLRTPSCARSAHHDCPHISGMGGGFNPRRLRPEFGVGLCPCTCHASCPVVLTAKRLTVPMKTWDTTCTCPGAQQERHRLTEAGIEIRDFAEIREDARRQSRARREAYEAARARAAGKSHDEIRDIYLAERRARDLNVPSDRVLDAVVERITTGNPLPAARIAGEGLVRMGKALHGISKLFRQDQ